MSEGKKEYPIPYTMKLKHPVKLGNEEKTEIVFPRRLKVKDIMGIPDNSPSTDRSVKIASRLTGEFQKVFEEMDIVDIQEVVKVVESFLEDIPETGNNA